jgi:hypothetical protein
MASLGEGFPAERPSPGRRRVGRVSALDRDDGSGVSLHDQLPHLGSEVQPAPASAEPLAPLAWGRFDAALTLSAADSTRRQIEYLHADGIDLAVERLVGTREEPEV